MKKVVKKIIMSIILAISFISCSQDINEVNNKRNQTIENKNTIPTFEDIMKSTNFWPSVPIESEPKSVTIELNRDADFIVFTRENGEVLTPRIPTGKKFKDVITAKKGIIGFILPTTGTYILHIYQKKDESTNYNMEDKDFRGKIYISDQAIKVKVDESTAPSFCERHAIFQIRNDSYALTNKTTETVIDELLYTDYDEQLTKERCKNYKNVFYTSCFRYTNLAKSSLNNPKQYKVIELLFPFSFGSKIDRGGFILKGVEDKGNIIYYGQPTTRSSFYSMSGTNVGQIINTFTPIDDKSYETQWK